MREGLRALQPWSWTLKRIGGGLGLGLGFGGCWPPQSEGGGLGAWTPGSEGGGPESD